MILKPFNTAAVEALEVAGVLAPKNNNKNDSNIKELLENNGASLAAAARALGEVLSYGEPNEKIRATQLVFQAHGVLKEADRPSIPSININITGAAGQKSLIQLITPSQDFYAPTDFIPDNEDEAEKILSKQ